MLLQEVSKTCSAKS